MATFEGNPDLLIINDADVGRVNAAGDVITYTILVQNNGNVTLTGVNVHDQLTGLNKLVGTLAPGASTILTTTYTVKQSDIDNQGLADGSADGNISNVATVTSNERTETSVRGRGISIPF